MIGEIQLIKIGIADDLGGRLRLPYNFSDPTVIPQYCGCE